MAEVWWQQDVQLYQQIIFSRHAIGKIRENNNRGSFDGIFCYIQLLLSCMGNISKLLNNSSEYCAHLQLDRSKIKHISNRDLRNFNEHIDERLNNPSSKAKNHSDMALVQSDIALSEKACPQRAFNCKKETIQFVDAKKGIVSVSLIDVEAELSYLSSLEPISYVIDRYQDSDTIF